MRSWSKAFLGGVLFLPLALGYLALSEREVAFSSRESLSPSGAPVVNRVKWIRQPGREIWMMNQSHYGAQAPAEMWDRLAIVVAGGKARFYQLAPGELNFSKAKRIPNRASCFVCHSSGPRALRPAAGSLGLSDTIRVALWNLRIKAYGALELHPDHEGEGLGLRPVRLPGAQANAPLKVAACTRCHGPEGWNLRAPLLGQHAVTMKFLVEQGEMPPPGFSLSADEKKELEKFWRLSAPNAG